MKKFMLIFIFFAFNTVSAKIVLKPGILDFEKLSDTFPELKQIITNFSKRIEDRTLFKNLLKLSLKFYKRKDVFKNTNLIERTYHETFLLLSNVKILKIEKEKTRLKDLLLRTPLVVEVKRKIVKFIMETKTRLGFGCIIQYEPKVILYMDKYVDFTRILKQEIVKNLKKEQ